MIHFDTFPIAVCSVVWRLGVWICSKGGGSASAPEAFASWRGIDFWRDFRTTQMPFLPPPFRVPFSIDSEAQELELVSGPFSWNFAIFFPFMYLDISCKSALNLCWDFTLCDAGCAGEVGVGWVDCNFHLSTRSVIVPNRVMGPRDPKRENWGLQAQGIWQLPLVRPQGSHTRFYQGAGPVQVMAFQGMIGDSDGHSSITGSSWSQSCDWSLIMELPIFLPAVVPSLVFNLMGIPSPHPPTKYTTTQISAVALLVS